MSITNSAVIEIANRYGFELVGFSAAEVLVKEGEKLKSWLGNNYNASMDYMHENFEKRIDVNELFPGAVTVISLGMNYYKPYEHTENPGLGKISRYAWGMDYHQVIWKKLDAMILELKAIDSNFDAKGFVDSAPTMDKVWAMKGGLGWMGKNTNVINRYQGSWFFIATLVTNYPFELSTSAADLCGECTACIDACPTNAFIAPYILDANKCISYQTIENKVEIDENLIGKFDNWIFGCDICQDVCPWNIKFATASNEQAFEPRNGEVEINLETVKEMTDEEFKVRFRSSPIKRTKLAGLKRNAEFLQKFGSRPS